MRVSPQGMSTALVVAKDNHKFPPAASTDHMSVKTHRTVTPCRVLSQDAGFAARIETLRGSRSAPIVPPHKMEKVQQDQVIHRCFAGVNVRRVFTMTAAGRSGGSAATSVCSAWRPPAEAPITMISRFWTTGGTTGSPRRRNRPLGSVKRVGTLGWPRRAERLRCRGAYMCLGCRGAYMYCA
jgi:hypothetical protein